MHYSVLGKKQNYTILIKQEGLIKKTRLSIVRFLFFTFLSVVMTACEYFSLMEV